LDWKIKDFFKETKAHVTSLSCKENAIAVLKISSEACARRQLLFKTLFS